MTLTAQPPWFLDCLMAVVTGTHSELAARVPELSTGHHYLLAMLLFLVAALRAGGQVVGRKPGPGRPCTDSATQPTRRVRAFR